VLQEIEERGEDEAHQVSPIFYVRGCQIEQRFFVNVYVLKRDIEQIFLTMIIRSKDMTGRVVLAFIYDPTSAVINADVPAITIADLSPPAFMGIPVNKGEVSVRYSMGIPVIFQITHHMAAKILFPPLKGRVDRTVDGRQPPYPFVSDPLQLVPSEEPGLEGVGPAVSKPAAQFAEKVP
jgi:hypothetical protein